MISTGINLILASESIFGQKIEIFLELDVKILNSCSRGLTVFWRLVCLLRRQIVIITCRIPLVSALQHAHIFCDLFYENDRKE